MSFFKKFIDFKLNKMHFNKIYLILIATVVFVISFIFFILSYMSKDSSVSYNLFETDSYYANYEVTVISNKNRNIYNMEEWYKKCEYEDKFKFRFFDFLGNKVEMIFSDNNVKILNESEINKVVFEGMGMDKINLLSLATYIDIINNMDNKDLFNISDTLNDDGSITYVIKLKSKNEYSFFGEGLKVSKLELVIFNNIPQTINVYEGDDIRISIDYIDFKDEYFEDDMFV